MTPVAIQAPDGSFVSPTPENMLATVATMKPDEPYGLLQPDPQAAEVSAAASGVTPYPLTYVQYALTPAQPLVETDCSAPHRFAGAAHEVADLRDDRRPVEPARRVRGPPHVAPAGGRRQHPEGRGHSAHRRMRRDGWSGRRGEQHRWTGHEPGWARRHGAPERGARWPAGRDAGGADSERGGCHQRGRGRRRSGPRVPRGIGCPTRATGSWRSSASSCSRRRSRPGSRRATGSRRRAPRSPEAARSRVQVRVRVRPRWRARNRRRQAGGDRRALVGGRGGRLRARRVPARADARTNATNAACCRSTAPRSVTWPTNPGACRACRQ